jgi:ribosome-associated translation inhibitor RaiA
MQIQINSDGTIDRDPAYLAELEARMVGALGRFGAQITRVEVHLADENGTKGGDRDKRCTIEARIEGVRPIAVSHNAAQLDLAINGATAKLKRSLGASIGRLRDRKP